MSKNNKKEKRPRGRRYFLTISKYEMGDEIGRTKRSEDEQIMGPISVKEKLKNLLVEKEDSLSHYMIGEESHVDGTKHYHIYLKYIQIEKIKKIRK